MERGGFKKLIMYATDFVFKALRGKFELDDHAWRF